MRSRNRIAALEQQLEIEEDLRQKIVLQQLKETQGDLEMAETEKNMEFSTIAKRLEEDKEACDTFRQSMDDAVA